MREKRRNNMDSPQNCNKKVKYQENGFLSNECFMISDARKDAIYQDEKRFHYEETKENNENSNAESKFAKERNNCKDISKCQRSILQYFSTQ